MGLRKYPSLLSQTNSTIHLIIRSKIWSTSPQEVALASPKHLLKAISPRRRLKLPLILKIFSSNFNQSHLELVESLPLQTKGLSIKNLSATAKRARMKRKMELITSLAKDRKGRSLHLLTSSKTNHTEAIISSTARSSNLATLVQIKVAAQL